MTANVGKIERIARAGVAVLLLGAALVTQAWPLALVGAAVALTALTAFSPLYRLYGLSTAGGLRKDCGPGGCALPGSPNDRRLPGKG
jgi:hypothetical protein